MPTSKTIEFELRDTRITARRVPDDGQYVQTPFGAFAVPKGNWIVDLIDGYQIPCSHETMKVLCTPKDQALRKSWNKS